MCLGVTAVAYILTLFAISHYSALIVSMFVSPCLLTIVMCHFTAVKVLEESYGFDSCFPDFILNFFVIFVLCFPSCKKICVESKCDSIFILVQFEDFSNHNVFELLAKYETSHLVFNDDIQGTTSVVLSRLVSSLKLLGATLVDHTFLFLGAGEAGTGIAELIALEMSKQANVPVDETRKQIWLVDSKVTSGYLNLSSSPSSNYVLNG